MPPRLPRARTTLRLAALVAAAMLAGPPAGAQVIYAPGPPPALRYEPVPPPPYGHRGVVWNPGRWQWDGYRWVWVGGHYVERPPHRRGEFVPGHWRARHGRWEWIPDHWR